MSGIVLTAYSGAILGPIAKLLGWIMNGIYIAMYKLFGIENVGLSIILLTILIYMCMLPLTIKQQKFSKISQKMQPEMNAIRAKYNGKTDQASAMAMQQETQLIYEKYGVSPSGSCVQMLIQMPIWFALYRVFYNVPAYIGSVKDHFADLVSGITATEGFTDTLPTLMEELKISTAQVDLSASGDTLNNYIIDLLYKVPSTGWDTVTEAFPHLADTVTDLVSHINNFNYFIGLNISDTPWNIITTNFQNKSFGFVVLALLIPVAAYASQLLNLKLMPQTGMENDQTAQQMKMMNKMMPLMQLFLSFTVPVGLGIYWIFSALCRAIQQFFINKHFEKIDMDEVIRKNQEKAKKKREKKGISENQIRQAAAINTKNLSNKANVTTSAERELEIEKTNAAKAKEKEGSLAYRANMVREFNERNSRK